MADLFAKQLRIDRRANPGLFSVAPPQLSSPLIRVRDRLPDENGKCPPCFNCLLPAFNCINFGTCSEFSGRCDCPSGFGSDDCSAPLCGSLSDDNSRRPPRVPISSECECTNGWQGLHCNVCDSDFACNPLLPPGINGTCYRSPIAVNENHANCLVTNPKILNLLRGEKPQVTLSCNATGATIPHSTRNVADPTSPLARCGFQFWIGGTESFYCDLDQCVSSIAPDNSTAYDCGKIKCQCIPGRMLCGKDGFVDIREFLSQAVKGPGKLRCLPGESQAIKRTCDFTEPAMDSLISDLLGDTSIQLTCTSGECLHASQIPGNDSNPGPPSNSGSTLVFSILTATCLLVVLVVVLAFLRNHWRTSGPAPLIAAQPLTQAELDKLMTDHIPATMVFSQIQYQIPIISAKNRVSAAAALPRPRSLSSPSSEHIHILNGIDGVVRPGEIMAIMGGSGAGKSTCLDILARRAKTGKVSGSILINGRTLNHYNFRQMCGFVDQEDTLMSTLTVEETILYSALLRLPKDMSYEAKCSRVKETMVELGILHISKSRIGDSNVRGISGGEKRRVSIACELVTSPSILFLDEPTSGLDSYNAHNVIECLRNLARNYNRTIILTIHQPRSDIFAVFDQLLLLSRGHLIYSGPAQEAVHHFSDIGFQCPIGYNIADYLIDITVGFNSHIHTDSAPSDTSTSLGEPNPIVILDQTSPPCSPSGRNVVPDNNNGLDIQTQVNESRFPLIQAGQLSTPSSSPMSPAIACAQSPASRHLSRLSSGFTESRAGENLQTALFEASHSTPTSPTITLPNTPARSSAPSPTARVVMGPAQLDNGQVNDMEEEEEEEESQHPLISETPVSPRISRTARRSVRAMAALRAPLSTQFRILADRTFKNLCRNPYLLLTHYAMAVVVAVLCGLLFWQVTADIAGFQNRMGCFFFVCALFGFSCLSSLQVFASERVLFTRERANSYYSPITYFAAKIICDIFPLRVVPPILLGCIIYNMVGLVDSYAVFLKFLLVLVLFNVTAAALSLFISLAIHETSVASLVASLAMLFSMLFGGLLLNKDSIPTGLAWLKHLSFFNYALEALIVNELKDLQLTENKYGLQIEVPAAVILSTFGFNAQSYWTDVYKLIGVACGFLFFGFIVLQLCVKERR